MWESGAEPPSRLGLPPSRAATRALAWRACRLAARKSGRDFRIASRAEPLRHRGTAPFPERRPAEGRSRGSRLLVADAAPRDFHPSVVGAGPGRAGLGRAAVVGTAVGGAGLLGLGGAGGRRGGWRSPEGARRWRSLDKHRGLDKPSSLAARPGSKLPQSRGEGALGEQEGPRESGANVGAG